MKSSTKGLIALLAFVAIIGIVAIIIVTANRATTIDSDSFYNDYLYEHQIESDSLNISNDTWTFRSGNRNYVVYLYNIDNSDQNKLDNYNYGVRLAAELSSSDSTLTDEEKTAAWQSYVESTRGYNIYIDSDYTEWASSGRVILYTESNRYGVSVMDYVFPAMMLIVMVVFMVMVFRSMRGGGNVANDFGKSKANVQSSLKVRFTDVAGAEEEKEELAEIERQEEEERENDWINNDIDFDEYDKYYD